MQEEGVSATHANFKWDFENYEMLCANNNCREFQCSTKDGLGEKVGKSRKSTGNCQICIWFSAMKNVGRSLLVMERTLYLKCHSELQWDKGVLIQGAYTYSTGLAWQVDPSKVAPLRCGPLALERGSNIQVQYAQRFRRFRFGQRAPLKQRRFCVSMPFAPGYYRNTYSWKYWST